MSSAGRRAHIHVRRMLEETGETAAVAAHVMALSDANKRLLLSGHQVCG